MECLHNRDAGRTGPYLTMGQEHRFPRNAKGRPTLGGLGCNAMTSYAMLVLPLSSKTLEAGHSFGANATCGAAPTLDVERSFGANNRFLKHDGFMEQSQADAKSVGLLYVRLR